MNSHISGQGNNVAGKAKATRDATTPASRTCSHGQPSSVAMTLAPLDVNLGLRRITMKFKRNLATVQRLTLGLLIALLWVGVAQAAPVYQGKFALPYAVYWGQAVLPAGEYRLRFQDVGRHVFVVIEDAESHQEVALVPAMMVGESRGRSVLLIAGEGNRRVVQSLSLAELGQAFTY